MPVICCRGTHYHVRPTQNVEHTVAFEPLLVAINLVNRIIYSTEASRPQRKQLLPLVPKEAISKEAISKEAISKEAISKEAISKEAISKEAISKEAILNAPTSLRPLPHYKKNGRTNKLSRAVPVESTVLSILSVLDLVITGTGRSYLGYWCQVPGTMLISTGEADDSCLKQTT
jgi:hypothetical protein